MAAGKQTREIRIVVDTKGAQDLKGLADKLGGITRNTKTLADNMKSLTSVFQGWIAFLGVRELVSVSDSMQNLNNRIVTLTGSQEEANKVMAGLLRIANETNTSIDSVAEAYARLGAALGDTDISQSVLLDTVKTLTNTFRLSGSTLTETTATIIQLGQAFSSGEVRGQELRSVMEQNVYVGRLLRKEFGKDIYKKAQEGSITAADAFRVLFRDMDNINKKAEQLTPTIGQTLTKALNGLKVEILELNKKFNIAGNFAQAVDYLIQKLPILALILTGLALTQVPALASAIVTLGRAMLALTLSNPWTAIALAASIAIVAMTKDIDELNSKVLKLYATFLDLKAGADELANTASGYLRKLLPSNDIIEANVKRSIEGAKKLREEAAQIRLDLKRTAEQQGQGQTPAGSSEEERNAYLEKLAGLFGKAAPKAEKLKSILGDLNEAFLDTRLSAEQYNDKLISFEVYKVTREFREGKFELDEYKKRLDGLTRNNLTVAFNNGLITLQQYNEAISSLKIDELNYKLKQGKITLSEYNTELAKAAQQFSPGGAYRAGLQGYIDAIGTSTQQVGTAITSMFTSLESGFLEFIKTGQFNFAKFTQQILDDLLKIIIRAAILKPLAEGLLGGGLFSSGASSGTAVGTAGVSGASYAVPNAKGNVFPGGIHMFANGGIVSKRTGFGFGNGQTGVMGEAGPEAILPLTRGDGGKLGVQASVTPVTINIVNNSSAQVEQNEKTGPNGERLIEVMIINRVQNGIANGSFDKAFGQTYGLKRKGQ